MFEYNWQKRVVAATPLISLFLFLYLGFFHELWHPGWLVFFLIPLMPFMVGLKKIKITFSIVIFIIYIILGISFEIWHPAWIIFLLIPIYYTLTANTIFDKKEEPKKKNSKNTIDME